MQDKRCAVFTGGGTGGHVYPGLAVIEELRGKWDGPVVWVGSKKGIEKRLAEEWGLPYHGLSSGKLRRYFSFQNFLDLFLIVAGFVQAFFLLKKLKPAFVFSKGGFVSVPPVAAARLLGIPVYSHDSDENPGLATRLNLKASRRIYVAYDRTRAYFAPAVRERVLALGNPVRQALFAGDAARGRAWAGVPDGLPLVLVLGGSLGARQVNQLILETAPRFKGKAFFVHQSGQDEPPLPNDPTYYFGARYFNAELADLLAAADVLISRAGAGSLWEMAAAGLPGILVPLGAGSRGDQVRNAEIFEHAGAAVVLGTEASPDTLTEALDRLLASPETRAAMKAALAGFTARTAAPAIVKDLLEDLARV